jgi:HK97 family phage prohead protease
MRLVSADHFKALARSSKGAKAITGLGLRKQMIAPIEPMQGATRTLRFTISTAALDREQDVISITGWDLSNYLRNSVVLWAHDAARLPIGRALDVGIDGAALKATVEFIPQDTPEGGAFAEAVYRLAAGGFLAATSVGFRPVKWSFTDDPERGGDDWFPGIDFEQQELVEFSIVTVPANPEALIEPAPVTASDTPPTSGEEVTAYNEEQAKARARRRRVLQLAQSRAP